MCLRTNARRPLLRRGQPTALVVNSRHSQRPAVRRNSVHFAGTCSRCRRRNHLAGSSRPRRSGNRSSPWCCSTRSTVRTPARCRRLHRRTVRRPSRRSRADRLFHTAHSTREKCRSPCPVRCIGSNSYRPSRNCSPRPFDPRLEGHRPSRHRRGLPRRSSLRLERRHPVPQRPRRWRPQCPHRPRPRPAGLRRPHRHRRFPRRLSPQRVLRHLGGRHLAEAYVVPHWRPGRGRRSRHRPRARLGQTRSQQGHRLGP